MPPDNTREKTIKSTVTAFDIIEAVAEGERPTVSEIAADVDHSRSTVHYHLKTLKREGYVMEEDGGFRLGLRMARLGELSLQTHRLTGVVEQPTADLAAETDAVAHVAVNEGDSLVWLYRSPADGDDLPTAVGAEIPIHASAYGQAILAHASGETLADLPDDQTFSAVTAQTLTDRADLEERLDTVRELGFAYSAEEFLRGTSSIAAPILDGDEVVGSIGISDASDRIDDPYKHAKARRFSDELPGSVRKAAQIASDHLADR